MRDFFESQVGWGQDRPDFLCVSRVRSSVVYLGLVDSFLCQWGSTCKAQLAVGLFPCFCGDNTSFARLSMGESASILQLYYTCFPVLVSNHISRS